MSTVQKSPFTYSILLSVPFLGISTDSPVYNDLLTNREKNSSVTFMKDFEFNKFTELIQSPGCQKLVLRIEDQACLEQLLKFTKSNSIKVKIYKNKKKKNEENYKNLRISSTDDYIFIIIEL